MNIREYELFVLHKQQKIRIPMSGIKMHNLACSLLEALKPEKNHERT